MLFECDTKFDIGSKSDPEEGSIAEDIATNLFDQENYSLQVKDFYPDLKDEDYKTHLAMVHSRFSTNTFPSWDRAQPNRFMSHNGEINTLLGNKNWMTARQGVVSSDLFGDDIDKLFPIAEKDCSDSGTIVFNASLI